MICVSFKKKGQLGKGQGTRKGKQKQLEKKQNDGSGLRIMSKERAGQKNIAQKQVAMGVRKKTMLSHHCAKKMAKSVTKKNTGDESKKQSNPGKCLVRRKRMKMMASRIFTKIKQK